MAMTMRRFGRLLLGVHYEAPPTHDEWRRWLKHAVDRRDQDMRVLVQVYGALGPSANQRRSLADVAKHLDLRTAVLTDSFRVRGVVRAVGWTGIPIRAYGVDDYPSAVDFLGLTDEELQLARETLYELRREAGVPSAARPSMGSQGTPNLKH